jgi:hypothetical protein
MGVVSARRAIEIDWKRERQAFEVDGSLRDVYVLDTTIDDWRAVIEHFESGPYGVRFTNPNLKPPIAPQIGQLVGAETRPSMFVDVGEVLLACHLFKVDQIRLEMDPRDISESNVRPLLELMADLGDLTGRTVVLTPENMPDVPYYRYAPENGRLEWVTP